jgi:hypothetical protein
MLKSTMVIFYYTNMFYIISVLYFCNICINKKTLFQFWAFVGMSEYISLHLKKYVLGANGYTSSSLLK